MVATMTDGPVTYTGFDPEDNGKRWVSERGNIIFVNQQESEWTRSYIPISTYDKTYLEEAKRERYVTPPFSIEKRILEGETAYHFWKGKDYWFFDKNKAIEFIYNAWDEESA